MREARRYTNFVLVGTLVLATILRLAQIGSESLWLDEAYSVGMVQLESYSWLLFEHPTFDPHPPLHYILLKPWVALVGSSTVAVRLQSVLFGVATVAVVYYLGRELFGARTGLYGAILVTIAPVHIWHAQNIRMYALLAFLTALSTLALVWLTQEFSRKRIALYVLSTVALGYTHVFGLFVIMAQTGFLLTRPLVPGQVLRLEPRRWLGVQGVVAVLLIPWGYALVWRVFVADALSSAHLTWISAPSPGLLLDVFTLFASGANLDPRLDAAIPAGVPLALAALSATFILGALFRVDLENPRGLGVSTEWERIKAGVSVEEDRLPALWLLALLFVVPVVVPYLLSIVMGPILVLRYTIPASIGFYLLVARGARKIRPPPIQFVLVALLVVGLLAPLPAYYAEDQKGQWDEAAGYVSAHADEDDLVIVAPQYAWWPWSHAHGGDGDIRTGDRETANETIREWIRGYDRVFLVYRFPGPPTRERFKAVVGDAPGRNLTESRSYVFVTVHRYDRNRSAAQNSSNLLSDGAMRELSAPYAIFTKSA